MPNLWKLITKTESAAPKIEEYQFRNAELTDFEAEEIPEEKPGPELPEEKEPESEPAQKEVDPLGFARYQSEEIIKDAKVQAEAIVAQVRAVAEADAAAAKKQATEEGFRAGYQLGIQQGTAKAMEENLQTREALGRQVAQEQEVFLEKAQQALERQMKENLLEMRDLSIAIAEKVICISLKSSSEVISKMIQMAVDKRKRREWVHIYIAETDARRITTLPPALSSALSELSDHVRIIPMVNEESGTCLIEFPDEIIDASANTQIQNIKDLLNSHGTGAAPAASLLKKTEGKGYVSSNDSSGLQRRNLQPDWKN